MLRPAIRSALRPATRSGILLGRRPWTPAALFAQGQQGVWYEPKPQYLYQDAAGTVPVTADGDPVGRMLDQSPNGSDASQSTASYRSLYSTDGSFHWTDSDGIDDFLSFPAVAVSGAITVSAAIFVRDPAGTGMFIGESTVESSSAKIGTAGGNFFARLVTSGSSLRAPVSDSGKYVITLARDDSGVVTLRVNGADQDSASEPGTTSYDQTAGSNGAVAQMQFFNGLNYGMIIAEGANNIDKIESYLAKLAGITL